MLKKKPLTVDFDALLGPKVNLEKLASSGDKEVKEVVDTPVEDKTAGPARLISKIKSSGIGTKVKKRVKADFSHLTKNKRVDPNESTVTRAGKAFGLPDFLTLAR